MTAYHLAALPPALLLIAEPTLWPWALAVAAFVVIAAALTAAHRFRNERDEARENAARANRRADAVEAERDIANGLIERLRADRRERSNVIPFQRDGSEPAWPEITRQIQHDDLTALMRAVEED